MSLSKRRLLILTIVVEGGLALVYLIIEIYHRTFELTLPGLHEIGLTVLFCIPLLIINFLLFGELGRKYKTLLPCYEFREQVVRPLVNLLDPWSAILISLLAGAGEELFFRGVIQPRLGIAAASLMFALLHFPGLVMRQLIVLIIYIAIGFYFGLILIASGGLWTPVLTHALYDYLAILFLIYCEKHPNFSPSPDSNSAA